MLISRVLVSLLFVVSICSAQKAPSIVGTWVPDQVEVSRQKMFQGMEFTFGKNGVFSFKGPNLTGSGTYKVENRKLKIVLTKRGGSKPTHPKEREGTGEVVENGKVILLPTGASRNGEPIKLRIVRKK